MKILLFFLPLISILATAQDCKTFILTKPGAEVSYKNLINFTLKNDVKKMTELTTITYHTDSINVVDDKTFIYLTKSGVAVNDSKMNYKKADTLTCSGSDILIDFSFLFADTTYICDRFPSLHKYRKDPFMGTTYTKQFKFKIPLNPENTSIVPGGECKYNSEMRGLVNRSIGPSSSDFSNTSAIYQTSYNKVIVTVDEIKNEGKETVETDAGNFECTKFSFKTYSSMDTIGNLGKLKLEASYFLYYNAKVGVVKLESFYKKRITSRFELIRIKR